MRGPTPTALHGLLRAWHGCHVIVSIVRVSIICAFDVYMNRCASQAKSELA